MEKSTIVGHRKGSGLLGVQMCWGGRVVGYLLSVPLCVVVRSIFKHPYIREHVLQ